MSTSTVVRGLGTVKQGHQTEALVRPRNKFFKCQVMNYRSLLAIPAIICIASGCNTPPSFEGTYDQVSPATLQAGDPIPQPEKEPLLTITGLVNATQQGVQPNELEQNPSIQMDEVGLTAVGLIEYTIEDPFEGGEATFRGVLMQDLLDLWQISPEATHLTVTALNDYQVQIPVELLRSYPVMLALYQNGERMQEDYRGPAMLVMPPQYHQVEELTRPEYWAWQITSIKAE